MAVSKISGVTTQPNSSIGNVTNSNKKTFLNLLISQDRQGTVFHELFLTTTGNIDSCKIGSIEDAKNIMNSGETFKIAQQNPSLPNHLKNVIA
jgi:hypothetical protein